MGKVYCQMSMSLDGFINDREGSVGALFPDLAALRDTQPSMESILNTGAVVMGRNSCDRQYRKRYSSGKSRCGR